MTYRVFYRGGAMIAEGLARQMLHRRPPFEVPYTDIVVAHSTRTQVLVAGAMGGIALWSLPAVVYIANLVVSLFFFTLARRAYLIDGV